MTIMSDPWADLLPPGLVHGVGGAGPRGRWGRGGGVGGPDPKWREIHGGLGPQGR